MTSSSSTDCTNETPIPDAQQPLIYFFILTTIYTMLRYHGTKINLSDKSIPEEPNTSFIWHIIYILLLVIGNYFLNLNISTQICGVTQWGNTLLITLVPWVIIFGLINLLLELLPGWLSPFSNTIGYGICSMTGLSGLINKIFIPRAELKAGEAQTESQRLITYNLEQIYSDRSLLINEANPSNFETFWSEIKLGGLLRHNVSDIERNQLYNFVVLKDTIALYVWYILTGMLVTSVAYNYMVNSNCITDVNTLEANHKAYEKLSAQLVTDQQNTISTYTLS